MDKTTLILAVAFGLGGMAFILVLLGYITSVIKAKAKINEENSFKVLAEELAVTNKKLSTTQEELMKRVNYIEEKIREVE